MQVSAAVFPDPRDPEKIGQDWPRWARENLVDIMMPMIYSTSLGNIETGKGGWFARCVKWQLLQTRGTSTLQSTGLGTTNNNGAVNSTTNMIAQTLSALRAGADSVYVFANDNHFRNDYLPQYKTKVSDAPFLRLESPNGGEKLRIGSNHTITWTNFNNARSRILRVKIMLSENGGRTYTTTVTGLTANTGSFSWTVPNDANAHYRLRVIDASNPSIYDFSNDYFTVGNGASSVPDAPSVLKVNK